MKDEKKLSRRMFIKGTVLGVGALAAIAGIDAAKVSAAAPPRKWRDEADVIVVGLGVAGVVAAIEASDHGAKVLVLEKGPGPSGASPVSSGTVWLPLNPIQGHPDSVEEVVKYLTACAKLQGDEALIRTFAENTKETAEWLFNKIGLKATQPNRFDYHPLYPGAGRGRNVSSQGKGAGLMSVLVDAAKARKIQIRTGVRVLRLVVNEQARVIGVMGEKPSEAYKAKRAVVLCTGGFINNEAMKKSFLKVYPAVPQLPSGLTGDGILAGMGAGAALEAMSEIVGVAVFRFPGVARGTYFSILSSPSCIMVNRKGRRFCNESADYDTVSTSFYTYDTVQDDYENVPAWVVFDEQVRAKGPVTVDPGWSKDNSEEMKQGWIKKADSLADLAAQMGVNAEGLVQTVDTFNQSAADAKDPSFRRGEIQGTAGVAKLSGPPFYGIQAWPGLFDTIGGLKINNKSQVVNVFGEVIQGLYSAGTNAHMALGFYYPNGGTALGQPMVFGRIAGRNGAAEKPWK